MPNPQFHPATSHLMIIITEIALVRPLETIMTIPQFLPLAASHEYDDYRQDFRGPPIPPPASRYNPPPYYADYGYPLVMPCTHHALILYTCNQYSMMNIY
ncbi:hypothetical protein BS47DRAFT_1396714 [Hydnum rufescens UP504]|uniref:Uncharacterized protein n=1 Tax=Hydnum rufescens UP504 TaxID=1448309 RepID=A0A9P6DSM2_9AGAM|nr:hypothetical protein BS47DRAFT_1396714 [Hydnum rufescens UP504]